MKAPTELPATLDPIVLDSIIRNALLEDIGFGDVTTNATVPPDLQAEATVEACTPGVVAGLPVVAEVYRHLDPNVVVDAHTRDGSRITAGEVLAVVKGPARSILTGERVALNFLQRMSGIATLTAVFVERVASTRAIITDTRKTTPGLRVLEKYAVRMGGGYNHRMGLSHAVLIKDNHKVAAGGIREAVHRATMIVGHTMTISVECETLDDVIEALEAGADIVLLDNMTPDMLAAAVRMVGGRAITEASGGVNLENVAEIAATGVDCISVGALTHSAPALDIRMELHLEERS